MWECSKWLTPISEIPQDFHHDSVSNVNVASSDVTQVIFHLHGFLNSSSVTVWGLSRSELKGSFQHRHKGTWVLRHPQAAGADELVAGKAAAAPAVNCAPIRAGCGWDCSTSRVSCIRSHWLFKSLVTLANVIENLMVCFGSNACWMLGFGYRAEIFRTNFPESICFSSRGRKRFKDGKAAHTSIHVVKGQNMKLSPELSRDMFG